MPFVTVKLPDEVPVPAGVVTVTFPVVVAAATVAVIWVALFTVKLAAALPLNATVVVPLKFVPVITTDVPTGPLPGFTAVIVGAATTVKLPLEIALPTGVVTVTCPVVVPFATDAVICVALFTVKLEAAVALNFTAVAPVKFVPVITTDVPTTPLVGVKLVIVGELVIVKLLAESALPAAVVTVIFPVLVPLATVAVICVSLFTVKLEAAVELNLTTVAPVKPVPVIVTVAPAIPLAGLKLEIVGAPVIVKSVAEVAVPPPVVTVILPLVDPGATVAVI